MFHPTLGRWLQEDPIGFRAGDSNLYRYEGNNATNLMDPRGLAPALPPPARPEFIAAVLGMINGMVEKARKDLERREALYKLSVQICKFNQKNPNEDFNVRTDFCLLREAQGRLDTLERVFDKFKKIKPTEIGQQVAAIAQELSKEKAQIEKRKQEFEMDSLLVPLPFGGCVDLTGYFSCYLNGQLDAVDDMLVFIGDFSNFVDYPPPITPRPVGKP